MDVFQKLVVLVKELESSDEIKIISLCNNLKTPIQILEKNYLILEKHFEKHINLGANKSLMISEIDKKIELMEFMNELNRLIHNYISSSQTLVDLQRVNYNELHKEKNSFPEYQTKVNSEFQNNPLCRFIQDLRNYFLHKGVPPISSYRILNGMTQELKVLLLLDKRKLLNTYNWKKESLVFINSLDDEVCLTDIIKKYHNHVLSFQDWYKKEQNKIFNKEYEFVANKEKEIKVIGIKHMFSQIRSGKGFTRNMLEQYFMRFADYEDAKAIFETEDIKERGQKVMNSIRKTINIPNDIAVIIMINYNFFDKNIII